MRKKQPQHTILNAPSQIRTPVELHSELNRYCGKARHEA